MCQSTTHQIELKYFGIGFSTSWQKMVNYDTRFLPSVIKYALVLAQTNAESERSLSINPRIVTQERASLGEKTVLGYMC